MEFPPLIAFEYSEPDSQGFPTAIAWTLESALYKAALIQPDDAWVNRHRDDVTAMDRPVSELFELGENRIDVVRELLGDRDSGTLYAEEPDLALAMLEQLFDAVHQDNPFTVEPMRALFQEFEPAEVERTQRLYMDRLDLAPQLAEQNILLWRATYAHLREGEERNA